MLAAVRANLLSRMLLNFWPQHVPAREAFFMDAALQAQLTYAALGCSVAALFFSIIAAFPGLKGILAAVRDGILWFALLVVLGGVGFLVWQRLHLHERAPVAKAAQAPG
jgi:hypothetical protein